jgi:4-hydroxy-tetrahydrodipicolinate synthase
MSTSNQPARAAGVYAALVTPRAAQSTEADAAALLDYVDRVAEGGVDGLVLFGSTGEFVHFDAAERMRVLGLAIRRSRLPVLVNVSHSTLAGAIVLAENAIEAGAAGLLLMPPFFYRYSDQQIATFYHAFATELQGKVPLYLYNLPMYANPIPPPVVEALLRSRACSGIKDSTLEWTTFERWTQLRRNLDFALLVGNEVLYLRGRREGADGIVSGVAAALPELMVAIERAIRGDDIDRAQRMNARLEEFLFYVNKFPATAAIRQAANARGWHLGDSAVPFDDQTRQEFTQFERWLDEWLPQVLPECAETRAVRI